MLPYATTVCNNAFLSFISYIDLRFVSHERVIDLTLPTFFNDYTLIPTHVLVCLVC